MSTAALVIISIAAFGGAGHWVGEFLANQSARLFNGSKLFAKFDVDSEQTPTGEIELVVERYWLEGLSLDQARRRAVEDRHRAGEQAPRSIAN